MSLLVVSRRRLSGGKWFVGTLGNVSWRIYVWGTASVTPRMMDPGQKKSTIYPVTGVGQPF